MIGQLPGGIDPIYLGYLVVFGGAAVACFGSIGRARRIEDPDTRRGLVALLVTSGAWAGAHTVFLLVPTTQLKIGVYVVGLIVGFSTVGPWLYFCSAYTGRSLHRNPVLRRTAVLVFLAVVAVKVTNPVHHLYFTTAAMSSPFPHLAVDHGVFHWVAVGFSYTLAAVGAFMLLELFVQTSYDTRPFAGLIALTGLPLVLDLVGVTSGVLVDISYEPLGVAAFALGVFFVYLDRFQAIQVADDRDEAVFVLTTENRIRDYNDSARTLFPELSARAGIDEPLETVVPRVAESLRTDTSILELERDGVTRYYRVTVSSFGAGPTPLGRLLTLTDITHREQYRWELERQNERLESFANMVSHDLRNPIEVANAGVELARTECDSEHLDNIDTALDRMDALIDDVLTLARQGQPIDETTPVRLSTVAEQSWDVIDTPGATLQVESDARVQADPERLQQLLENLFRNAIEHGGTGVTIRVGAVEGEQGFYVADDGPGIPSAQRDQVFESGFTTAEDGTGFGLAIVAEIVDAHDWTIDISDGTHGGARFDITGVESETEPRRIHG